MKLLVSKVTIKAVPNLNTSASIATGSITKLLQNSLLNIFVIDKHSTRLRGSIQ